MTEFCSELTLALTVHTTVYNWHNSAYSTSRKPSFMI